jgi:hypothetical protein
VRTILTTCGVVLALAAGVACGPIEYLNQVSRRATTAVEQARAGQAEQHAPYEYYAAREYLHKAREEAGYADFEAAIEYGRKAEELARKASKLARERSADDVGDLADSTSGAVLVEEPPR